MSYTRAEFIGLISEPCIESSINSKILASLIITQAALESGNGNSRLTKEANNLFGIKAGPSWNGPTVVLPTREVINGKDVTVDATWRVYPDWFSSIKDHSALLTGAPRYAKVVGETDYKKACQYIREAGYATDPEYTNLLIQIIEANHLYIFDSIVNMRSNNIEQYPGCFH